MVAAKGIIQQMQSPFPHHHVLADMTKDVVLSIQNQLLQEFLQPEFVMSLNSLSGKYTGRETESECQAALKALVRARQMKVIPQYGLPASEDGLELLWVSCKHLRNDTDFLANRSLINDGMCLRAKRYPAGVPTDRLGACTALVRLPQPWPIAISAGRSST